jgi:hypothetical protein
VEAQALKEDGVIVGLYATRDEIPEQRLRVWRMYAEERSAAWRAEHPDGRTQPTQDLIAQELADDQARRSALAVGVSNAGGDG